MSYFIYFVGAFIVAQASSDLSVACPESSYCASKLDCPKGSWLRNVYEDCVTCTHYRKKKIRLGICCMDIPDDEVIARNERAISEMGSDQRDGIEDTNEKSTGESSGSYTNADVQSNDNDKSGSRSNFETRKYPPIESISQPFIHSTHPGIAYSARSRRNFPQRRKIYLPSQPQPSTAPPVPKRKFAQDREQNEKAIQTQKERKSEKKQDRKNVNRKSKQQQQRTTENKMEKQQNINRNTKGTQQSNKENRTERKQQKLNRNIKEQKLQSTTESTTHSGYPHPQNQETKKRARIVSTTSKQPRKIPNHKVSKMGKQPIQNKPLISSKEKHDSKSKTESTKPKKSENIQQNSRRNPENKKLPNKTSSNIVSPSWLPKHEEAHQNPKKVSTAKKQLRNVKPAASKKQSLNFTVPILRQQRKTKLRQKAPRISKNKVKEGNNSSYFPIREKLRLVTFSSISQRNHISDAVTIFNTD